jgi:2'-phosphotransferase
MARGGRGGGRGGHRAPEDRDTQISKKLSYVLRHGAQKEKISLDKSGYANCQDILNWQPMRSFKLTFAEMNHIVETNAKKRYELIPIADENGVLPSLEENFAHLHLIRASQGHSIAIESENLLTPLDPDSEECPTLVVHGTYPAAWKAIQKSGGLSRMGRGHVHFALGPGGLQGKGSAESFKKPLAAAKPEISTAPVTADTALREPPAGSSADAETLTVAEADARIDASEKDSEPVVVSGLRTSATVLIWVDVKRSGKEGGIKWWKSANGVVLTEGDEKGFVKMDWVDRVEERDRGGMVKSVLWSKEDSEGK